MVPDYDDDDVVEDYEEVRADSGVRKVSSAKGGPVQRPSKGVKPSEPVRPPTTASPALSDQPGQPGDEGQAGSKGKISKSSAKLIWIICIAVTVIGVGLFVADIAFDAFGRRAGGVIDNGTADNRQPHRLPQVNKKGGQELTEHQVRARGFAVQCFDKGREIKKSRAYDFARVAIKRVREAQKAGMDDRGSSELWVAAWKEYYAAESALELFTHKWPYEIDNIPLVSSFKDYEGFEGLTMEQMDSDAVKFEVASYLVKQELDREVKEIKKGMMQIAAASNAMDNAAVKEAKARWEKTLQGQFEQADLDYVNRPPRDPDKEPPPY
ncbi:MAG: hypothetical protein KF696_02775 [Planctomycetes bacterium]|nr:hypothetical protein [Planctomycetota bacterium]MCW8134928.1 hypothetical protein [Planctomycetota bacterium]